VALNKATNRSGRNDGQGQHGRLTRVQVTLDVEAGSLLEKAARGMRFVKRAVRADLAGFKAFIEMQEVETGAWRGEP
jgi:hypothetical protein